MRGGVWWACLGWEKSPSEILSGSGLGGHGGVGRSRRLKDYRKIDL